MTHGDGVKDIAFSVEDCKALFAVRHIDIHAYDQFHSKHAQYWGAFCEAQVTTIVEPPSLLDM